MPKIKDRYILFSGSVQGTNDGDIPSIYLSPTNFTPQQVSSEGNDKVSAYLNGINTALGVLATYNYAPVTKEPTGFPNRTDSVISFDNSTRTFTIEPAVTEFSIYIQGVKQTFTAPLTVTIPDVYSNYYFFILPNGTLDYATTFDTSLLSDKAYISYVLWDDVANEAIIFAEERHGLTMDWATHGYLHQSAGLQLISGANIEFDANGDGTQASDAQVSLSDMTVFDEDIRVQIVNDATPSAPFEQILFPIAEIPIYYRDGVKWVKEAATQYPMSFGTVRANYNFNNAGTFSLEEAPNDNDYVATYVFATTSISEPVIALLSQDVYTSLDDATDRANWAAISFGDIPFQEIKLLYIIYYKTNSTYTNAVRSKVELVQDFRFGFDKGVSAISQITDHSLLTGLAADDHLQYLNRSGVRPMTGNLSLGSNNITNIGTANGVVIEAHASRHLPGGADALTTATAASINANSTNTEGTAISFARSDHTHDIATGAVSSQTPDQANAEGTSANLARADHVHNIVTATPVSTGTANAQGAANTFAKSDHVHNTVITSSTQKATASTTTTSATDVLLNTMTITPAAGTYKIMAHVSALLSANTTIFFSLYVGGTQVTNSEGQRERPNNSAATIRMDWSFFDDVVVNGSQSIEIRWRVTTGTGTAFDRQLSISRVG